MSGRGSVHAVMALAVVATGCSTSVSSSPRVIESVELVPASPSTTIVVTLPTGTDDRSSTTTSPPAPETTDAAEPSVPDAPNETTTTTATTTTTTTLPPLDVYDPACVERVQPGDTLLELVVERRDDTIDVESVIAENGMEDDQLEPFQLLDLCVDNGLDDIDGSERDRNPAIVRREVEAQQRKLNQLFEGYGIRELLVDGISGPVTRQRLCAFRLAVGLPVSTADMVAGSEEEQELMATETLPIPFTSSILSDRWILIDQTCQIMFVGLGYEHLQFVFPTATGVAEYPTRPQNRSPVFKYNSASHNNGWHNSYDYPAAEDNPLNGNMYKPLYFDRGQAIHGANNVPRSPASKGCARLRVHHQDMLIDWLGLGGVTGATSNSGRIDVTVNVQGSYQG